MLQFVDVYQNTDKSRRFDSQEFAKSEDDGGGRGYQSLHDFAEKRYLEELRFV